jgi:heme-degrading monooxygenase HmoA
MFARVSTAQAGIQGFDTAIGLLQEQLPGARQLPGFTGFYLLTDAETGKLIVISLWDARDQTDAVTAQAGPSGIRSEAGTELTALHPRNLRSHGTRDHRLN